MGDLLVLMAAIAVILCGLVFSLYHNLKDGYKITRPKPRKDK